MRGGRESHMEKKKDMVNQEKNSLEKMEEGQRPQSIFSRTPTPLSSNPDPEVQVRAIRRKYPGDYKLRNLYPSRPTRGLVTP
jgi:hypothetical protein